MEEIFSNISENVLDVAKIHLLKRNSNYLKFASEDMINNSIDSMVGDSVSFALGYTGHGNYLYDITHKELKKQVEAGILTRMISYPDDDFELEDYQKEQGDETTEFEDQFGIINADPKFKRQKNPKEQMTQLDKLLLDNTMEDAFSMLGIHGGK